MTRRGRGGGPPARGAGGGGGGRGAPRPPRGGGSSGRPARASGPSRPPEAREARRGPGPRGPSGAHTTSTPAPPAPARARPEQLTPRLEPLPAAGEWVWTCREGFEPDLYEELSLPQPDGARLSPRVLAPALLATRAAPPARDGLREVTFARQGFCVTDALRGASTAELEAGVTAALRRAMQGYETSGPPARANCAWALHVWVPDSAIANRLSRVAETLQRAIELRASSLDVRWADRRASNAEAARDPAAYLAQVCLAAPGVVLVGGGALSEAISRHPGGRARMRVADAAPSRAAMKLEEALDWIGHGPAAGETCVDLGAAPGGWTYVVMQRGARVVAIDPGSMAPELASQRGLAHIRGSAFDYEPPAPVDWLLCDMVWRPLEVAALLARWARRRWARFLVANIKLPMRGKVEFVGRVRATLTEGGWQNVRVRQLYHDREEVTLHAYCAR